MKGFALSLILSCLFFSNTAFSQTGNIHGYVKEAETGDAMIGASVFLKGTSTGTTTDFNGEFTLSGIKVGEYNLEISYLGFSTLEQVVSIDAGTTQEVNASLEYEAVSLLGKDIVVTAQASAQMAAINKQRSSKTIANVISVKRIQELPDANAAEVVGRLPGVSLVREGGEGSKVVIRGLAPKYNNVTLEGVKLAATGNGDRSTDMSMISPFMLEGIEVTKAALPDKDADAHGGTINFVLKEAPKGFQLFGYLSGGMSILNPKLDNKVVLGLSNRFFNDKLGIFVQGDFENRNRTSHSLYAHYKGEHFHIDSLGIIADYISLKNVDRAIQRKGGALVFDFKIPHGSIKFSNFGSSIGKDYLNILDNYAPIYSRHIYQVQTASTDLLVATNVLSIKETFGPFSVKVSGARAYSRNESPEGIDLIAMEDGNAFSAGMDFKKPAKDIISYAKYDYVNARLEKISATKIYTKGTQYSVIGSVEYTYDFSKNLNFSVKAGGKYKKLKKENNQDSQNIPISWGQHGGPLRAAIAGAFGIDTSQTVSYQHFVDKDYDSTDFLKGEYEIVGPFKVDDAKKIAQIAKDGDYYLTHYPSTRRFDYYGQEEYTAGFLMMDFKYKKKITFTPGFRYEKNTTTYTGVRGSELPKNEYQGYQHSEYTTTRENNFLLPMVHLKLDPMKWLSIRMAYTETLARPDFNQIVPSSNIQLTTVSWNNPYLRASKSRNMDFYVSGYRSKMGLASVGFFRKEITDLIFNTGLAYINNPADYDLTDAEKGKTITKTINNPIPVKLWGLETEYKTRFWYMDNILKGAVLNLNYTHIFSEVQYPVTRVDSKFSSEPPYVVYTNIDTSYTARFLQQPNDIFNATIGYDIKGFSARVSYLYRTAIFSRSDQRKSLRANSEPYSRWDVSFKQSLPKGFEVMLNFANIFSKSEIVTLDYSGYDVDAQYYGTTIDLGLRYRFQ